MDGVRSEPICVRIVRVRDSECIFLISQYIHLQLESKGGGFDNTLLDHVLCCFVDAKANAQTSSDLIDTSEDVIHVMRTKATFGVLMRNA